MAHYRIAIMNEDIAKFVYDSMQQRTKRNTKIMRSTSLRAFFYFFFIYKTLSHSTGESPQSYTPLWGAPR